MSESVTQEIILKRLLLAHQRSLSNFSSDYISFLNSPPSDPIQKEKTKQALLQDLSSLQFQVFKYQTSLYSLEQDNKDIQTQLQITDVKIESNKKKIVQLEAVLVEERKIMEKKMEYNRIAQQIKAHGKRSETLMQIEAVKAQIEVKNKANQKELESIAQQESYLLTMISSLSCLIETTKKQ